jgi:ABC-type uncharacterized transport system permease subunit
LDTGKDPCQDSPRPLCAYDARMRMKPVFAVPVVLLVLALALLIGGVAPLWWIVALVALAVTLILLVVGEGVRR